MIICNLCNRKFETYKSFSSHIGKKHIDYGRENYYKNFINKDVISKCICGKDLKLENFEDGFKLSCSNKCRMINLNNKIWNDKDYVDGQKLKMSKQSKEFWKDEDNRKRVVKSMSKTVNDKINKGLSHNGEYTKERSNKQSKMMKQNWNDNKFHKVSKAMKDYWENNREAASLAVALNAPLGGRCKFFEVEGLRAQGRYELAYILNRINNGLELPKKAKTITTPYGFYTPDFEFIDFYVEVKSTYTIKTCKKSGQMERIKWVDKNIKDVKFILMTERKVKEIIKNSNYDLEKTKAIRIS